MKKLIITFLCVVGLSTGLAIMAGYKQFRPSPLMTRDRATTKLQAAWRGHATRKSLGRVTSRTNRPGGGQHIAHTFFTRRQPQRGPFFSHGTDTATAIYSPAEIISTSSSGRRPQRAPLPLTETVIASSAATVIPGETIVPGEGTVIYGQQPLLTPEQQTNRDRILALIAVQQSEPQPAMAPPPEEAPSQAQLRSGFLPLPPIRAGTMVNPAATISYLGEDTPPPPSMQLRIPIAILKNLPPEKIGKALPRHDLNLQVALLKASQAPTATEQMRAAPQHYDLNILQQTFQEMPHWPGYTTEQGRALYNTLADIGFDPADLPTPPTSPQDPRKLSRPMGSSPRASQPAIGTRFAITRPPLLLAPITGDSPFILPSFPRPLRRAESFGGTPYRIGPDPSYAAPDPLGVRALDLTRYETLFTPDVMRYLKSLETGQ